MKLSSFLFIGSGLGVISLAMYYKVKKNEFEKVFEKLEFNIKKVSNFNISLKHIALSLDVQALNPTATSLYINTGFIKAKVLRVYHKKNRKLLAFSNLNTTKIELPMGSTYTFPPVHIKIPLLTGGELLLSQLIDKDSIQEELIDQLDFEIELNAFGSSRVIKL